MHKLFIFNERYAREETGWRVPLKRKKTKDQKFANKNDYGNRGSR